MAYAFGLSNVYKTDNIAPTTGAMQSTEYYLNSGTIYSPPPKQTREYEEIIRDNQRLLLILHSDAGSEVLQVLVAETQKGDGCAAYKGGLRDRPRRVPSLYGSPVHQPR